MESAYQLFGYASGLLIFLGTIPYIRDIFVHTTKPQRATWFIYTVLGSISFFSQLAEGATFSLWLTGIDTFSIVLIFLLSIRYGVGGFGKKDTIALIVAGVALGIWYITKEAAFALYLVIGIDAVGTYLTVDKTYKDPESETLSAWVLCAVAGACAMIAVGSLNIVLLSYPLYICIANSIVSLTIIIGRKKNNTHRHSFSKISEQ